MIGEQRAAGSPAGLIVRENVVPPGEGGGAKVRRGQVLRIVDQAGKQGVDFLCYNADHPEERYHAANTMKKARSIWLSTGHVLYSDAARPMFTIVGDTCGRHDTIGGCCSAPSNFLMYGGTDVRGCRETFLGPLGRYGVGRRDIVAHVDILSNALGAAGPMVTSVWDTCGRHDTIGGCCSAPSNFLMYGVTDVRGCRETFLGLLGRYGMGRRDIVANFNFFSNVPVGPDGTLAETVFI